jgi:flagellar biosynthesis protein FliR
MAVMLSAPVIVALLLTQFVMGLISKAVPTVNIFIISFPLTIGIGLLLTIAALPEMMVYMEKHFFKIDKLVVSVSESTESYNN